jgi:hypothetical protein
MILILLLVAVGFLAYYLARRDFDKKTVEASRGISAKAKAVGGDVQGRVKDITGRGKTEDFIAWATGPGAQDFPEEFNNWFGGLSDADKKSFSKALAEYVDSLGMSLTALTSGRLDKQTDFKKVFVETLVIYSSAYRKIAEAKTKPEKVEESEAENQENKSGEIKPAEKAPSRRTLEPQMESAPSAS